MCCVLLRREQWLSQSAQGCRSLAAWRELRCNAPRYLPAPLLGGGSPHPSFAENWENLLMTRC